MAAVAVLAIAPFVTALGRYDNSMSCSPAGTYIPRKARSAKWSLIGVRPIAARHPFHAVSDTTIQPADRIDVCSVNFEPDARTVTSPAPLAAFIGASSVSIQASAPKSRQARMPAITSLAPR